MLPSTKAPSRWVQLRQSLDRTYQKVKLFVSSKITKERTTNGEKHDSMFSAPFFQFLQASNDDSTTATPAIYTIRNSTITIQNPPPPMPAPRLHHLPLSLLTRILRPLLVARTPLILHRDAHTPSTSRTRLHPSILRTASLFHHVGTPLLYGANTLTTSSPRTSQAFDTHLLALPGPHRQLIKAIKLEIDWADELWAKFPLIARVVGEIAGLKRLEIVLTKRGRREGARGEMMRKVEEKCLGELVMGDLRALEELRLVGFENEVFALTLERDTADEIQESDDENASRFARNGAGYLDQRKHIKARFPNAPKDIEYPKSPTMALEFHFDAVTFP